MTRLSPEKPIKVIRVLESLGFIRIRQKGSHIFFRHPDGRCTVIPMHQGEDLGRGLLRKILSDIDITPEQFRKMLR